MATLKRLVWPFRQRENKTALQNTFADMLLNYYIDLVIVEKRKTGELQAYEGIRIVKEQGKDGRKKTD